MSEFYENKIVPITINDLDISLMERVRNLARSKNPKHPWITMSDMEIFRSAGLYERDTVSCEEGFNLAAVLLFGKDETIQKYFPAYHIEVIKKDDFGNYNNIESLNSNLILSYQKLVYLVSTNMNDKFYLEDTQRVSIRGRIAHEIISNLLIHRDYSSQNHAKIIIEKDKITIENPNKPHYFGRIQPDNCTPYFKNPIIVKFFCNIGRADKLGSGMRNLCKYLSYYSNSEPLLIDEDVFRTEISTNTVGIF